MPRKEAVYHGTNSQGNSYTNYSDGSYSYKNYNSEGSSSGNYYSTGNHAFYTPSASSRASGQQGWHDNYNRGTRNYY